MRGFRHLVRLSKGLTPLLAALLLTWTASGMPAEPTQGGTLKFVSSNDLKVLDPFWTTAYISRNHGYMIYDVLFVLDENLQVQPRMWRPGT
jgi:peptide/nickel transport system substrate-binding protein